MLKPVLAIVGRPNVGKSTLFNRLTRSRNAIVVDAPGATRDRHYGEGRVGSRAFIVIDTGGLEPGAAEGVFVEMARQAQQAIVEADAVVFLLDARAGIVPADRLIAEQLRRSGRRITVAVNKAEGMNHDSAVAEFHEFGFGEPLPVSAAHGEGVSDLVDRALEGFPETDAAEPDDEVRHPRVAVVGRPNVGKSTLVNALVGEERVIAFDEPGTTRDPIEVPFEREGRRYTLIDTAGLRRRGRQGEAIEKFSVIKALQAIEASNVAILVIDARDGVIDQDAHVAGYILERGRAVVLAVNKWDVLDPSGREAFKRELDWKLDFLGYAERCFLSARDGTGLGDLYRAIDATFASAMARLATPRLTRALQDAVERQAPPRHGLVRPKLRYAHQGGINPPRIIIHGNALGAVPDSYRRYLEGFFRRAFSLVGTPLAIEFRTHGNPFAPRRQGRSSRPRG